MPAPNVRSWLREPLLQFLLAGAVLFAAYQLLHREDARSSRRIVITPGFVEGLRQDATRRNGHPPSEAELRALVDRFVNEEVLYREALALGLDRGDVIVRRRLVEKMQFLTEDAATPPSPTDAELASWLRDHREQYLVPARTTFQHVFVASKEAGAADQLLRSLRGGVRPETLGDPFVAGRSWKLRSSREIAATFGDTFAARVSELPVTDGWEGPIASPYGQHLVQVSERTPAREPTLEEVRSSVSQGWLEAHRKGEDARALQRLRSRYAIELPPLAPETTQAPQARQ